MSGQPNPFPRPKVTLKQWMIFLAVLAVFNYLAVLMVKMIPPNRFSAEQVRLRTAVAFLLMNGLVIGYGVFFLILGWWWRVYRHKRPDLPLRIAIRPVVVGLCFVLCIVISMLFRIAIESYWNGRAGMGLMVCQAASVFLSLSLFMWAVKKTMGKTTEENSVVDDPLDRASDPT